MEALSKRGESQEELLENYDSAKNTTPYYLLQSQDTDISAKH